MNKFTQNLTGPQKIAVILLTLNEADAVKIFSQLSEIEVRQISYAMATLGSLDSFMVSQIIEQFCHEVLDSSVVYGDISVTERLLSKFLDKDTVSEILGDLRSPEGGYDVWKKLSGVNEELLALYLREEHPQTIALVLSKLVPEYTSKVFSFMPEDLAKEVLIRILNIGSVKKDVLDNVEKVLKSEILSSFSKKTLKQNSYEFIAEVFNNMDSIVEEKYMNILENTLPEAAQSIKDMMFTFDDLEKLSESSIQILLRSIDKSKLTLALKGSSNALKEAFLSNMSSRAAKIIQDEMEISGPVRVKDVNQAKTEILNIAKGLIADGEIEVVNTHEEYI